MLRRHIYSKLLASTLLGQKYNYIRQKEVDEICQGYGDSKKQKIKMYTLMFAHIAKKGFEGAWADFKTYKQLRNKPQQQRTQADWNQLVRMRHDFYRLGPLWIIQILPMSGPLFILYMYTYPGSIPSWFIIDQAHEKYELQIRQVQKQAIKYFKSRNIKPSDINFDSMSLQQARKLAECLYGYYRDGTKGINKVFNKQIDHVINENFSKYLIKRKLRYKFNADLHYKKILSPLQFNDKIRWKYEQVVINNQPLKPYKEILTQQQLEARQQYQKEKQKKMAKNNKDQKQQKQKYQ